MKNNTGDIVNKWIVGLICVLPVFSLGKVDFHRVAWRSDPATSAVICWHQVSGENPQVRFDVEDHGRDVEAYRFRQEPDRIVEYRGMTNHFVRLKNLKPDTAYYYVVQDSEGTGRRLWFKTAPDQPQPFTFIAGGDSRSQPEPRREGNKLVAKLRPLFVLFGGDYTGSGNPIQWKEWLRDWQLTISEDGRIYPIIATHGNHENADMQMMEKLFDTPHPDQYYSVGIGGDMMRIWVLNSELEYKEPEKVPEQNAWLNADLPKHSDVQWKLVTYHRPMRAHTARKAEGLSRIKWWSQLFYDQGVDLVIESDTHMVKRSYPVRPCGEEQGFENFIRDDEKGFVFIGEGSWGAPKRPVNDDKPWTMASESFHQFKWIQAFPDELLIRSVEFKQADAVVALSEDTLFEEPENMEFWKPETGKILRLPFDAGDSTYSVPAKPRILVNPGSVWSWSLDGLVWADGQAPLGYGDKKVRTLVAKEARPLCAYFQKEIYVEEPSRVSRLFFDVLVDDGCVVKLNDKEVIRHNMPKGKVLPETLATKRVGGAMEKQMVPLPVDPEFLKAGTNVIMVRVHQADPESSDLVFDLSVRMK